MRAKARGAVQELNRHGLPVGEVLAIVAGCWLIQRWSHRDLGQPHGGAQVQVRLILKLARP